MPAFPSTAPELDPDLERERDHLARSRRQLARMRTRAAALDSTAAGDWVSQQVLESAIYRRMKALEDDPAVPLFFGRLDFGAAHPDAGGESLYIGRRHVTDEVGDPMVIDWRARISRAFYRASRAEPMGVDRRRRFGFQHGRLTAFEDERLSEDSADEPGAVGYSALLEAEIERPRVGPMRDIVATIQPEQDLIVRSELEQSVCVQGAPGTGKTAVGLHRAAYLLYAHRDRLSRQGVLVVGPNTSFLRYIGDVLPALGEIDAQQTTIEQLVAQTLTKVGVRQGVRGYDTPQVATLKGDVRMARVLERALWSHLTPPSEALVVPRGARRWRVAGYQAEEIVTALRSRGVRYGAARSMLSQRLAHVILVKMELAGESPDDRVQDAVARSRPVKQYVDQLWPAVHPAKLVLRLLGDPAFLSAAADGILSTQEQTLLLRGKPPKGIGSARWSAADAVLVDEADSLIDRTTSLGHVVADEAQDLSAMMLRAVGRRCSTGSATVLGDLAQATTPWGSRSWDEALKHLGKADAHVEELTLGFRVPGEVIEYAARLLETTAPQLAPPTSLRRARGELVVTRATDPLTEVVAHVETGLAKVGSVGLIVPDVLVDPVTETLSATGVGFAVLGEVTPDKEGTDVGGAEYAAALDVVPASLAKGLEFDHVLLLEPARIVAAEADRLTGLRRLYVCLTRAVTSLAVLHSEDLPAELGDPGGSGR
ncbi:MAG: ATP-dependent DNA helicase [uncultured Nocardioidaceae bacterium]|uniref:ATP-dependent DNA helicase n=1 Tax=uncultured Nocardioidaceae bacterium TaxID=253824 RepID=A0A6J4M8A3_9ACTN|nr:MAG: ATP-dependent DNA helicase [uncultured Nocardioidaceae bacterium]